LGDVIDYALARYYGPRIFEKFKINKHYYFERLEHGVREHAPLTVFITRFVGPLDLFVNLFAGSIKISAVTFITYDILGNFISNFAVLTVGYLAGSYWQNFSSLISIAGWILFVIIILFLVIRVFIRRQHRAHL
jgi:membrane-associated protein